MKVLYENEKVGLIYGVNLLRWYWGAAYEEDEQATSFVFRFGPLYFHVLMRRCL